MKMTRRGTLVTAGTVVLGGLTIAAGLAEAQEHHPEIRRAITALEKAKQYMQNAAHDFGGHREAALKECDAAIGQLREALKYDQN
ncbi:MAG TPA: hypothetical protein VEJ16_00640 [Alphaproteobacteria bacterium]|nr:hypothetical protein [Alphaproteobacteria bacterium]